LPSISNAAPLYLGGRFFVARGMYICIVYKYNKNLNTVLRGK